MMYNWLNAKQTNIPLDTIWSLFSSFLIKSFYTGVHSFLLASKDIPDSIKILIYSITGFLLSFIVTYTKNHRYIQKILHCLFKKSTNDDIFNDIIDYNNSTMLSLYLKSSNIYYVGKFSMREEKGLDSWIILINYCSVNKETNEVIYNPKDGNLCSSVAINLRDIERMEIIYENDSEVWKRLKGI